MSISVANAEPSADGSGPDIRAGRVDAAELAMRFADAVPPLTKAQAMVEAERCLYCHDAPCTTACPTGIDVPSFIRRIAEGNLRGAARVILDANPLGGICARVCPTEELCEDVCVRHVENGAQQGLPVAIGRLQRHAVDAAMAGPSTNFFKRAASTGRRIVVIGAGPAGIACAHTLARLGHDVEVHDAKPKPGGLNEYGLAAYKTAGGFAQREWQWLLEIGGITLRHERRLESLAELDALREDFDAVFLGLGLTGVQALRTPGEALAGVRDAVDFIAELRQTEDLSQLAIGRRVVVIGGGMTAVDAAVQSKLLGAESVQIVYRRGLESMSASKDEQRWAQTSGVTLRHWLAPEAITGDAAGHVTGVRFARQLEVDGRLQPTGEHEWLPADMVFKAIGQRLDDGIASAGGIGSAGFIFESGRLKVDDDGATGVAKVWAGGDCRFGGRDLTVEAVEDGKRAAMAIHASFA